MLSPPLSLLLQQLLLLLSVICCAVLGSQAGDWIRYTPGNCNIIVAVPHGGSLRPEAIPKRTHGCLSANGTCNWTKGCSPSSSSSCGARLSSDSYTKAIGDELVSSLSEAACQPHYVASLLHRSRMDPNRDLPQAAQGDQLAEAAWQLYHHSLASAVASVQSDFGRGFLLDIHGQTHSEQWVEIGMLLSGYDLNNDRLEMERSSIRSLAARSQLTPRQLVSGSSSLGGLLQSLGYSCVPSPQHPGPNGGGYYSGGYTTERHGSRNGGSVDALQVEAPSDIRKSSSAVRLAFARDLASAVLQFRTLHGYAD